MTSSSAEAQTSPQGACTQCTAKKLSFVLCQGWFPPGQMFLLDEYCARYGVRGCYRHLCYLEDLLDKCEKQQVIDPTLIHFSYAYCASHVHGNK